MCRPGHANRTGLCEGLKPACDVDRVPEQITSLNHHVPDTNPSAEPKLFGRDGFFHAPDGLLNLDRALHSIDDTRELREHTVARGVRYAAPVLAYEPVHDFPVSRQPPPRSDFVLAHEPRVVRHVSGEDGGELALDGLGGFGHGS